MQGSLPPLTRQKLLLGPAWGSPPSPRGLGVSCPVGSQLHLSPLGTNLPGASRAVGFGQMFQAL